MLPRILAVDDEPTIVRLVEVALSNQGYKVSTASSGAEALEKAKAELPDLVLLDIMMPGMDGHEVQRRLREDPATADIPVVFLTAVGDVDVQLEGLEQGAIDFITKPFDPLDLRARVRELLDPSARQSRERDTDRQKSKLRTYKEIMRRKSEGG